jgi:precorrin-6B methylase 1
MTIALLVESRHEAAVDHLLCVIRHGGPTFEGAHFVCWTTQTDAEFTMTLALSSAEAIIAKTLAHAKSANFKPLGIVVLDARGTVKAASIADGW